MEPLKTFVKNIQQIRLIKGENNFSKPETILLCNSVLKLECLLQLLFYMHSFFSDSFVP